MWRKKSYVVEVEVKVLRYLLLLLGVVQSHRCEDRLELDTEPENYAHVNPNTRPGTQLLNKGWTLQKKQTRFPTEGAS